MEEGDHVEERTRITFEIPHKNATSPTNYAIVTYSGSQDGFANIQEPFRRDIAAEPFLWKRSYGKVREVTCHVQFEKYREPSSPSQASTEISTTIDLMGPMLNSYWCDCQSLDAYKGIVKSHITTWLEQLEAQQLQDWIIVVLVRPDAKKSPRTRPSPRLEIYDRICADFCTKLRDRGRCVYIMDSRSGLGDADAWHAAVLKFRQLVYDAYESKLRIFEERLRVVRENRSKPDWKLSEYISMREMLATAYQRLNFPEDALVHLDESTAIISQFVAEASQNSAVAAKRDQCTIAPRKWLGLNMGNKSRTAELKEFLSFGTGTVSLLELRSFLFLRQYEILSELNRAWEVTGRSMPFIQNVNNECKIFDVNMMPGALDSWTFLTCHEIRQLCQKTGDAVLSINQQDNATLLGLEREKLGRLGFLCGLMPNQKPTVEQQSLTEALSQAMEAPSVSAAIVKLYMALLSSDKFMKTYLELSEITMGTFKHVGRTRAAKWLGVELAKFYMDHGSFDKAAGFLLDALKMLRLENWGLPCADVAVLYTKCVYQTAQWDQFIKSALLVASSAELDMPTRLKHMDMFTETVASSDRQRENFLQCDGLLKMRLGKGEAVQDTLVLNQSHHIDLTLDSKLPRALAVQKCFLVLRLKTLISNVYSRSPIPESENFFTKDGPTGNCNSHILCTCTLPAKNDVIAGPDAGAILKNFPGVKCLHQETPRSFRSESFELEESSGDLVLQSDLREIRPGPQNLTFFHQFVHSDVYRVAELHVQYADSFTLIVLATQNYFVEVLLDPPTCNILPLSTSEGKDFWMHTPHDFRLFLTGNHSRLSDVSVSLKPVDIGCVEISDRHGSSMLQETTLLQISDHSLQFQLTCMAKEADYIVEILVNLPWSNVPEKFRFNFLSPLKITTSSHFCATETGPRTTLLTVAITNRWIRSVSLLASSLSLATRDLTAITTPTKKLVLGPKNTLRLIWSSEDDFDASRPFLFKTEYSLTAADGTVDAEVSHPLNFSFSAGLFGSTRLAISLRSSHDLHSTFLLGEAVQISFLISVLHIPDGTLPVFYQIKYDQSFWTSRDETSGSISLEDKHDTSVHCCVIPAKSGKTAFPALRLFYVKDEEIVPIDAFHVYNESTYRAVTVSVKHAVSDFSQVEEARVVENVHVAC